jgi:hypothetical protein
VNTQLHYEALRAPRPERRYIEGWPPPERRHPPPGPRRIRPGIATRLVRLARRIDEGAVRRALVR